MNPMTILKILLFLALTSPYLKAQHIDIEILDRSDAQSIPFVNICYSSTETGELADIDGLARLDLTNRKPAEEIIFSSLSYTDFKVTVGELLRDAETVYTIKLTPNPFVLEEVTVKDSKVKFSERKAGEHRGANGYFDLARLLVPGSETGVVMKIKDRYKLKEIRTKMKEVEVDSFLVEFNIYDYSNSEIGHLLQNNRIFKVFSKEDSEREVVIDVSDQHIWIESDIFVSIEVLRLTSEKTGSILFSGKTKSDIGYFRKPLGKWQNTYMYPMIYAVTMHMKE